MKWLTLITSLPTENATLRQRAWRSLRSSGAAILRDGVYLMPARENCIAIFEQLASELREGGGTAMVLATEQPVGQDFVTLFDRSSEYAPILQDAKASLQVLQKTNAASPARLAVVSGSLKTVRRLRKLFDSVVMSDFFPSQAHAQTMAALEELEQACARASAPDEPIAIAGDIARLTIADYQGRIWATRSRPWADRLASAWLIKRLIDTSAQIRWLKETQSCSKNMLGFDFDGATFTHVGQRVTFEVLLESFELHQSKEGEALQKMALLIHFLDVGGVQPPEAVGVEAVLAGMRANLSDDDALLQAASAVFDALLVSTQA
jgi:hypothetical protein